LIAFTGTSSDGRNTVWLINADGTQPRQLAAAGLSEKVLYPCWYPGGEALAVMDTSEEVIKRIDRQLLTAVAVTDHTRAATIRELLLLRSPGGDTAAGS
jgi:Tol biopolymer transport system component